MKSGKLNINIIILLFLIFFTGIGFLSVSCINRMDKKQGQSYNILIIQSFRESCFRSPDIIKGITDCFKQMPASINYETLFLDSESDDEILRREKIDKYLNEYIHPDLIFVADDQATYALLSSRNPATYTTPIVFIAVDYFDENRLDNRKNVTGLTTTPDYGKTYELIRSLYPQMKTISIDIDDTPLSQSAMDEFYRQWKQIDDSDHTTIQVNNMDTDLGSTFMWNATFVNDIPRLMPVWSRFYSSKARNTEVPFFSVNNKGIGQGFLGGYISPTYDVAFQAARIGKDILSGKDIQSIPIKQAEKVLVIDWKQMQKCGISPDKLPDETIFINYSFYEQYKLLFILLVILLIVILIGVFTSLIYLYKKTQAKKKRIQQELSGHRKRLQIVMSSIREGVISIDKNMHIFAINKAAIKWLQLKGVQEDYIGKSISSLLEVHIPQQSDQLLTIISEVYKENKTISLDSVNFRSKENNYSIPIFGSVSSIHQPEELYGAVIVFHDTSEELAQKEFLELTLGMGDVFSWRYDFSKKSVIVDANFFRRYGIDNNVSHCIPLKTIRRLIHPEDFARWKEENYSLLKGDIEKLFSEMRININEKGYQWWELRYTCIHSLTQGCTPSVFGLVRNVQSFKNKLKQIEDARDKARMSDRLKSAFLANMSHEIRTPLNAIVGFSNLLTSGETFENEERKVFIETIRNNCNLLLALISDVLDLAQIETGNMSFKEEICDVNELIRQIIITQQVIIPSHLQLVSDLPDETTFFVTDKLRLNQVITNLINNAVKFTEKGKVTVGYWKENEELLHFFVEDTGKGMPETDLIHIFERFFKKDDFKQGAGLGLSICKMIVDRFGGVINVTSEVGKGSRFVVTLPLHKICLADEKDNKANYNYNKQYDMNTETQEAPLVDRPTLLIAEDEESNYLLLKTILQKHCNLIRARTGKEALEKYQETKVDLIMLDIKMPEMTGIEALKEIRKLSGSIPVIMQSAYVFDSDMEEARNAGATDFITKPINIKILKETLSTYCPAIQW